MGGKAKAVIYFIQTSDNRYIKIGTANDPVKRLATIQISMPYTVRLIAVIPGDHTLEHMLHRDFRSAHVRGEWFQTTHEIVDYAICKGAALFYEQYSRSAKAHIFAELATKHSTLLEMHAEASAVYDDGRGPSFCANTVWYQRFKPQLMNVVGWYSHLADEIFHTTEAYSAAYQTIYNALPDCRGCMCG